MPPSGIQTSHPDYGRVDATSDTNEVMFDAFAALFDGGDCISGILDLGLIYAVSPEVPRVVPPQTRRMRCSRRMLCSSL